MANCIRTATLKGFKVWFDWRGVEGLGMVCGGGRE